MSAGGGGMRQLQEQLEAINKEVSSLEEDIEQLRTEKTKADEAIDAIDRLESDDVVQVPLGGDAYVRAEIQDINEIVVSLGGGYAAERDQDGAVKSLKAKKETLDERIESIQSEITELQAESDELEQQAQQMQQQQMQQLQQQFQSDE
ncbi:prefoldin subunit alpha [Halocatena halophila]|uniref:prefoldin subunit alpha n=1 Tax=Halocatena halophila TaxID=2814576 RepID=UPI002ED5566D